jgi:hypothetical protein
MKYEVRAIMQEITFHKYMSRHPVTVIDYIRGLRPYGIKEKHLVEARDKLMKHKHYGSRGEFTEIANTCASEIANQNG